MPTFHPDLAFARFIPPVTLGPRAVRVAQRTRVTPPRSTDDLRIEDLTVPGPGEGVTVRVYRPRAARHEVPAMLWIHGGGMAIGTRTQDEKANIAIARRLGIAVVSVEYRLTPDHPAPAALDDCYAALAWMFDTAPDNGIDAARVAIAGASAGGGLAAGVTLMAHDRRTYRPVFQQLVYPMLDDRTATRTDVGAGDVRIWTPRSNVLAWTSYLGRAPGRDGVDPYHAPARREDLSGLPPAWIGVGSLDLFLDEDLAYARKLEEQGVPCELLTVDGAFHGFDVFGRTGVAKDFLRARVDSLDRALFA